MISIKEILGMLIFIPLVLIYIGLLVVVFKKLYKKWKIIP